METGLIPDHHVFCIAVTVSNLLDKDIGQLKVVSVLPDKALPCREAGCSAT